MTNKQKFALVSIVSSISAFVSTVVAYKIVKKEADYKKERTFYELEKDLEINGIYNNDFENPSRCPYKIDKTTKTA